MIKRRDQSRSMMVMETEGLPCAKRAVRSLTRSPNLRSPRSDATAAAAVEKAAGNSCSKEAGNSCSKEGSVIRVKIVLSKEELSQLMEALSSSSPAAVEQLLTGATLRRGRVKRAECSGKLRRWRPELQSIPEEY